MRCIAAANAGLAVINEELAEIDQFPWLHSLHCSHYVGTVL